MSNRILLVDDDSNLRSTVEEFLTRENYLITSAKNAEEAVEKINEANKAQHTFDLLIFDVLMPGKNGLELAKSIRAQGLNTPLIFITGVFKNQANQATAMKKLRAHAFIIKPFNGEELLVAIKEAIVQADTASSKTVTQREEQIEQKPLPKLGNLFETPVAHFLWRIHRERHSGILDLNGPKQRGRLFFFRGRVTLGQSDTEHLNLGVQLVKDGHLTTGLYQQAAKAAMERRLGLYQILKEDRIIDDEMVKNAYQSLIPQVIFECVAMEGRFRWVATEEFARHIPASSMSVLPLFTAAISKTQRRHLNKHLNSRATLRLSQGQTWESVSPLVEDACGRDDLLKAVNGRATVAQLVGAANNDYEKLARMRQVFFLLSTGAVNASERSARHTDAQTPPKQIGGASSLQEIDKDAGIDFTEQERVSRRHIAARFKKIKDQNHWATLGLSMDATHDQIKKAYFELAKVFHTDAFTGQNLGKMEDLLQVVFNRITQAYQVLLNPEQRQEYERKLDMESKGLATDIDTVFEAEDNFIRGQTLMDRGEFQAALNYFNKACELQPGSDVSQAHRKYIAWRLEPSPNTAYQTIKEIDAHYAVCPAEHVFLEFQGNIAMQANMITEAVTYYKRCLTKLPKNVNAQRNLRLIQQRQQ